MDSPVLANEEVLVDFSIPNSVFRSVLVRSVKGGSYTTFVFRSWKSDEREMKPGEPYRRVEKPRTVRLSLNEARLLEETLRNSPNECAPLRNYHPSHEMEEPNPYPDVPVRDHVIVKRFTTLSTDKKGWTKELNLVSWNAFAPKYDLREWAPDHVKMSRGITMNDFQARQVAEALHAALNS